MQKFKLSIDTIKQISKLKKEPNWMLKLRLEAYEYYKVLPLPNWNKDLEKIDFSNIDYYIKPINKIVNSWEDLPEKIKLVYKKLKIPQSEKKYLAGIATQYESEVVYQNLKKDLEEKGVILTSMDEGLRRFPDIVKEYFSTLVPINDNKFAALNSCVWSGGVFLYVPKDVKIDLPLQAYFRINSMRMGQFERTLIIAQSGSSFSYVEGCSAPLFSDVSLHAGVVEVFVKKNARVRYSTIQNWSKNVLNLVTKRMKVNENAIGEWIDGNLGSRLTMKYPSLYLDGHGAKGEILSLSFASKGQNQDTGGKVLHMTSNTSSRIISKSISQKGGKTSFHGSIKVLPKLKNIKSKMVCDSLILDNISKAMAHPVLNISSDEVEVSHEATVGKINQEQLFYLQSRGIDYDSASSMLVNGFIDPIIKTLPMEYAIELNRLIEIELNGHK